MKTRPGLLVVCAVAALLSACGDGSANSSRSPGVATSTSTVSETPVSSELTLDTSLDLPGRAYDVAIKCWGRGTPTIVLEGGGGDGASTLDETFAEQTLQGFAQLGTVCVYDHAGVGASGPVPAGIRRTIRDVSDDLDLVLAAARVPVPYVLVGNSFGGFVAMDFAAAYPSDVGAVVLLDVPPPDATLTAKDLGGTWRENPDVLDALGAEHSLAAHPPTIHPIPLRAVVASNGQTTLEAQSFWLRLTPRSVSVAMDGDHGLFYSNPEGVIEQVALAVDSLP